MTLPTQKCCAPTNAGLSVMIELLITRVQKSKLTENDAVSRFGLAVLNKLLFKPKSQDSVHKPLPF